MNDSEKVLNKIAIKTCNELEKKINFLKLSGLGGSLKHEKLVFHSQKILRKEEGVLLISQIIELYLNNFKKEKGENINKNFSYKNLEIIIVVYDENGNDVYHPNIEHFALRNGVFSYLTVKKCDQFFYEDVSSFSEPYEEALKKALTHYEEL